MKTGHFHFALTLPRRLDTVHRPVYY